MTQININLLSAQQEPQLDAYSIVVIGQKLTGGSATEKKLNQVQSKADVNTLYDRSSHIGSCLNAVFDVFEYTNSLKVPPVYGISLDDVTGEGVGIQASGTFDITGAPTENGRLTFYVDKKNTPYNVDVVTTDTPTTIGDKLVSQIDNNLNATFTATNDAGEVTITYNNTGSIGNFVRIGFSGTIAGLTVVKSGLFLSGGLGDPDLANLFDAIEDKGIRLIVYPEAYDSDNLINFTKNRIKTNLDNVLLYGQGYQMKTETYANIQTFLNGATINERTYTPLFDSIDEGGIFLHSDVKTATLVAQTGILLTEGSNTSLINTGNGVTSGGALWSAIPYKGMNMVNFPVKSQEDFTDAEFLALQDLGGTGFRNNKSETLVLVQDVKTSLTLDTLGNPDETFKFLNYLQTSTVCVEYFIKLFESRYPRHKLTIGSAPTGQPVINTAKFIGTMREGYITLSQDSQYGLLRDNATDQENFIKRISETVSTILIDGKISALALLPIVVQFRRLDLDFQPTFN